MAVTPAGTMRATLGLNFEQFRTGTSQASRLAKTMSDDMSGSMGRAGSSARVASAEVKGLAGSLQGTHALSLSLARGLAGLATGYMAIQAASASITIAREFNAALAETSTLIEGTPQQLEAITQAARSMSRQFGGDATTQVKAFYQAISAGAGSVEEAAALIDTANRLAVGGVSDVTTATGILSGVLNTYGKDAITAAEASDALFVGVKAGVTTVSELSSSLGKILPASKALGISFDETVAATAALTKNSMTTSEAVTGLSAVLNGILQPTGEALTMAKGLGFEFNAAALQAKGLTGFLNDMVQATGGNAQQMAALFGSAEALKVALLFAGEAGGQYAEILDQMKQKTGLTDEAFQKISNSLDQRWNVAVAKARDIGLVLGNALLTVVVPAVEAVSGVFVFVANHGDTFAVGLTALAAAAIPSVIAGLTTLTVWLGTAEGLFIAGAIAARGLAIAMKAIPFVAVVTGTVAIYELAKAYGNASSAAGIQAQAADVLRAALLGVNVATDEGKTKANELAEATIAAARADVLAARIKMANSQAELQMNGGFAFAAAAQKAREEMERTQAVLAGLIAEADKLGLSISKTPIELANAGGQTVDLARLLAIARGEASGIATVTSQINMSGASGQALALAGDLGVALDVAVKLNAVLNANAGISNTKAATRSGAALGFGGVGSALPMGVGGAGVTFDSPPDVKIRNQQIAAVQNWTPAKITGGGAGGGSSEIDKTTKAIKGEILALEQAANPMLKYNAGIAHLNDLKKAGLSDKGYAEGISKLKKEMESATPAASALTSALTDGIGQAVDYMLNGFKGGMKGLLNVFKGTIMQMISYALKNKIMLALGIGGAGGIGSVAAAATGGGAGGAGGLLSTLTGGGGILGSLGTGLFGASPILGTGLMGGLGSTLSATFGAGGGIGGLFGIGANAAAAGGGLMAGLGAALPVLGIVAGVFSFFKTKTKLLDEGIRGTINMEAAMFESYQKIEKSKFWGLSKKTSYKYAALSADASAPMVAAAKASQDAVLMSADALGFAASTFDGFSYKFQLSLKGLDDAAKQAKVVEALTGLSDAMAGMVGGIDGFKLMGEGAAAALTRLSSNLVSVNGVFRDLGFSLQAISLAGGDAAYQFAQVFGGLDAMASATGAYYAAFYSDQERLANATARLGEKLAELGYGAIPATYDAFRQMVDAAMASGDQILGANLIQISSLFDQVKSAETQLAEQRLQSLGALEDRFTNAFDYRRAQSRVAGGGSIPAGETGVQSPEILATLQAIASSMRIMAADTARGVNATEDLLSLTLEGTV